MREVKILPLVHRVHIIYHYDTTVINTVVRDNIKLRSRNNNDIMVDDSEPMAPRIHGMDLTEMYSSFAVMYSSAPRRIYTKYSVVCL